MIGKRNLLAVLMVGFLSTGACSSLTTTDNGNASIVNSSLVGQVHKGMSEAEVRRILGSPDGTIPAGDGVEKWNYVHTHIHGDLVESLTGKKSKVVRTSLLLEFDHGKLIRKTYQTRSARCSQTEVEGNVC